jgi:hypothetical protein
MSDRLDNLKQRLIQHPIYQAADQNLQLQDKLEQLKDVAMQKAIDVEGQDIPDDEKTLQISAIGDATETQFQAQVGITF